MEVLLTILVLSLPILVVLISFDMFILDFMMIDWLMDSSTRRREKIEAKQKKEVVKNTAKLPSIAYQQGYKDMVKAFSGWTVYSESFNFSVKEGPYLRKPDLKEFAKRSRTLMQFDPEQGRSSYDYLRGPNEEWQQYFAGGMRFLSDLEEERAVVAEGNRLAEIRRKGAKELDRGVMESIRELEKIRNQAFATSTDHAEFDKKMKEIS